MTALDNRRRLLALRARALALRDSIAAEAGASPSQHVPLKDPAREARRAELRASTQARQPEVEAIGERLEARQARRSAGALETEIAPEAPPGMSMSEVANGAWENLGPSAKRFAEDIARVVTHPVETAEGLGNLIIGTGQLAIPGEQGKEQYAREVGKFFADRYGGWENVKRTMATDPVGFAADAATVLTGGGGLAARVPGMAGKVGQVAATAGRTIDPTLLAVRGAKKAGRAIGTAASAVPGMTTGAGTKAIKIAARSGVAGGELGRKFRDAMRGNVPMEEVVNDARQAVTNMYRRRSENYRSDMAAVNKDPTILDFDRVDDALKSIAEVKRFKGVAISRSTEGVRGRIREIVDQWRGLDPAQYHTVEGFDALKQALGDVLDGTQYGSPEWRVANEAYQAVKRTITYQAPEYAKVMKEYEKATALLKEMQGELSLGKDKSAATALRKLQAIIRDDVSSAYGRRAELGAKLEEAGARGARGNAGRARHVECVATGSAGLCGGWWHDSGARHCRGAQPGYLGRCWPHGRGFIAPPRGRDRPCRRARGGAGREGRAGAPRCSCGCLPGRVSDLAGAGYRHGRPHDTGGGSRGATGTGHPLRVPGRPAGAGRQLGGVAE